MVFELKYSSLIELFSLITFLKYLIAPELAEIYKESLSPSTHVQCSGRKIAECTLMVAIWLMIGLSEN